MPSDTVVVRRVESPVIDRQMNLVVGIPDQPAIPSETGKDREIAFGDAEGHIDPRRVSPFSDDLTGAQYEAIRAAAGTHRPERLVPRGTLLGVLCDYRTEIAFPGCLMLHGITRCSGESVRICSHGGCPRARVRRREIAHRVSVSAIGVDFRIIGTTS